MKKKVYYSVLVVLLLILVVSTTYAFFAPQQGGTTSTNATVTSNTTDLLTFSINRDISFTVTQADFQENGQNQSGDATATATLTPNNKTGAATMNYYLYLNIESNPTVYSEANINEDPELMLQVFDGSNQLVTLTGLGTQKTIKGVTGYDITGVEGLQTLLSNHAISASNNTASIENWRIVIILINLDVNQNDNTGKTIEAEIIIRQDEQKFTGTIYTHNDAAVLLGASIEPITGTQWVITNGTQDVFNYDSENECTTALTGYGNTPGYSCVEKTGTFGGVGTYETSASAIRTATYNVYCPIGQDKLTCNYNELYQTEEECLYYTDTSIYTCTAGFVMLPYYLKHQVEDNIIASTEVCLWYNNREFCIAPNYWTGTMGVNDEIEGVNTKLKLKSDMESALGTQADSCGSNLGGAVCTFGEFSCSVSSYGLVQCYSGNSARRNGCGIADFSSCGRY